MLPQLPGIIPVVLFSNSINAKPGDGYVEILPIIPPEIQASNEAKF